jgi:hypothetical protein
MEGGCRRVDVMMAVKCNPVEKQPNPPRGDGVHNFGFTGFPEKH